MRNGTKSEKRARGRPRAYDADDALGNATDAFWLGGYSGTSLDTLSDATGMNRPSLYAAFGDKHSLYLSTLDRYVEAGVQAMHLALRDDIPLPQALQRVYDSALALYLPTGGEPRGCFLIGTAVVESKVDDAVRTRLAQGLKSFDRAFEKRIRRAQTDGELSVNADAAVLARVASAILHSLALRSRAGDSRASLRATAAEGVMLICGARKRLEK
ncbi:transcriptional regulator, TetR family [Burkholderia sp. YR290]|jgi:AcrR family transcriptional regulator|uniref:TetR/AcrR family transcriptional regulator n=1 Tax=Paraburkholderia hospita TaxID=169430 RepID=UPI0009A5D45C|nr:TetR/AcrR family transcriptional regulator [Paraburkholderia hospita]SKC86221.1 transcriptional regulator, TetR family [Paraburkholderia hospita]SOE84781.1 transcriptional regulator, TetR family [Burkholderia sp. YR290]